MDSHILIAIVSIATAGITIAIGATGAALGEGRALAEGLRSIAQQPDAAGRLSTTLFIGLAMIESSAIYCFVIAIILLFANPMWNLVAGGV